MTVNTILRRGLARPFGLLLVFAILYQTFAVAAQAGTARQSGTPFMVVCTAFGFETVSVDGVTQRESQLPRQGQSCPIGLCCFQVDPDHDLFDGLSAAAAHLPDASRKQPLSPHSLAVWRRKPADIGLPLVRAPPAFS